MTQTLYLQRKNLGNDVDAFVLPFSAIPQNDRDFIIKLTPEDELSIHAKIANSRPLVGLLLALDKAFDGYTIDEPYLKALLQNGAEITFLHYDNVVDQISKQKLDGILLPGGWFPFPQTHYKHPENLPANHELSKRSQAYLDIIEYNKKAKIPLLGICGGMQMLANSYGTKMTVSIENELATPVKHVFNKREMAHKINITPNSKLFALAGNQKSVAVNSVHNEGIYDNSADLSQDIIISARSEDGLIEAVELPDFAYAIGVQWHPEYLLDKDTFAQNIYASFTQAAKKHQENKK